MSVKKKKEKSFFTKPLKLISQIFAACSVVALFLYAFFITDIDLFLNSDYLSFLTGAEIVASGSGYKLYDFPTQLEYQKNIKAIYKDKIKLYPKIKLEKALPFRNLPFVALILTPMTFLSPFLSFKIFLSMNIFLLVYMLWHIKKQEMKKTGFDTIIFVALLFLPVLTSIARGQLTIIALFVFYLIYKSLKDKESFNSGIYSGFLLLKIQYLFAIPLLFFLVPDVKKFIKGLLLTSCLLAAISLVTSGLGVLSYPKFLLLTEQAQFGSVPAEILTLFSVFRRISGSSGWAIIWNMLLYFIIIFYFYKLRKKFTLAISFGIIVLTTLLLGIHMTDNEVVLLLLPFLMLLKTGKGFWVKGFVVTGILASYLRFTPLAFWEFFILAILLVVLFLKGIKERDYVYG